MAFELPPLPYEPTALEPHMSAQTFAFHHGKHHKAYIDKTNAAIAGTPLESMDLVSVIRRAKADGNQGLFNNSAQSWNHNFYWQSLSPQGGGAPNGRLRELIDRDLGGMEGFAQRFKDEAVNHFASGWAWLALENNEKLVILSTHDADTPLVYQGLTPLLTLDVWEHAYYLDYQNARPVFADTYLQKMVNWRFAEANLDGAAAARGNEAPSA
jgi:Fe-Mn family superoxide dismutase